MRKNSNKTLKTHWLHCVCGMFCSVHTRQMKGHCTGITPFIPWEYIQVSAGNESINFQTCINRFVKVEKLKDFVNSDLIDVEKFAITL